MNGASQGIINENVSRWKGEQEGDSSAEEEGSIPAGDTDDSASVATENGKKEVDKSPPPPLQGQKKSCRCQSAWLARAGERNGE